MPSSEGNFGSRNNLFEITLSLVTRGEFTDEGDTLNFPNLTSLSPNDNSLSPKIFPKMTHPTNHSISNSSQDRNMISNMLSPITPHVVVRSMSNYSSHSILDSAEAQLKSLKFLSSSSLAENQESLHTENPVYGAGVAISDEEKEIYMQGLLDNYDNMDQSLKPEDRAVRPNSLEELNALEARIQNGDFGESLKETFFEFMSALYRPSPMNIFFDQEGNSPNSSVEVNGISPLIWSHQFNNHAQLLDHSLSSLNLSTEGRKNINRPESEQEDVETAEDDLQTEHYDNDNDNNELTFTELHAWQEKVALLSSRARILEADALTWEGRYEDAKEQIEILKRNIENRKHECKEFQMDLSAPFGYCFCGLPKSKHSGKALQKSSTSKKIKHHENDNDNNDEYDHADDDDIELLNKSEARCGVILEQVMNAKHKSLLVHQELEDTTIKFNQLNRSNIDHCSQTSSSLSSTHQQIPNGSEMSDGTSMVLNHNSKDLPTEIEQGENELFDNNECLTMRPVKVELMPSKYVNRNTLDIPIVQKIIDDSSEDNNDSSGGSGYHGSSSSSTNSSISSQETNEVKHLKNKFEKRKKIKKVITNKDIVKKSSSSLPNTTLTNKKNDSPTPTPPLSTDDSPNTFIKKSVSQSMDVSAKKITPRKHYLFEDAKEMFEKAELVVNLSPGCDENSTSNITSKNYIKGLERYEKSFREICPLNRSLNEELDQSSSSSGLAMTVRSDPNSHKVVFKISSQKNKSSSSSSSPTRSTTIVSTQEMNPQVASVQLQHYDVSAMSPNALKALRDEEIKAAEDIENEFKMDSNRIHFEKLTHDVEENSDEYGNHSQSSSSDDNDEKSESIHSGESQEEEEGKMKVGTVLNESKEFNKKAPGLQHSENCGELEDLSLPAESEDEDSVERMKSDVIAKTPNTRNEDLIQAAMLAYDKQLAEYREAREKESGIPTSLLSYVPMTTASIAPSSNVQDASISDNQNNLAFSDNDQSDKISITALIEILSASKQLTNNSKNVSERGEGSSEGYSQINNLFQSLFNGDDGKVLFSPEVSCINHQNDSSVLSTNGSTLIAKEDQTQPLSQDQINSFFDRVMSPLIDDDHSMTSNFTSHAVGGGMSLLSPLSPAAAKAVSIASKIDLDSNQTNTSTQEMSMVLNFSGHSARSLLSELDNEKVTMSRDLQSSFANADRLANEQLAEMSMMTVGSPSVFEDENSSGFLNITDASPDERSISVQCFMEALSATKLDCVSKNNVLDSNQARTQQGNVPIKSILTPHKLSYDSHYLAKLGSPSHSTSKKEVTWGGQVTTSFQTSAAVAGSLSPPTYLPPLSSLSTQNEETSNVSSHNSSNTFGENGFCVLNKTSSLFDTEQNSYSNRHDNDDDDNGDDDEEVKPNEKNDESDLSIIKRSDFVQFLQDKYGEVTEDDEMKANKPLNKANDEEEDEEEVRKNQTSTSELLDEDGVEVDSSLDHIKSKETASTSCKDASSSFVALADITSLQLSRLIFCLGPARDYRRIAEAVRKAGFDGLTLQEVYHDKQVYHILTDLGLAFLPKNQETPSLQNRKILKHLIHPLALLKLEVLFSSLLMMKGMNQPLPTQLEVERMKSYTQSIINFAESSVDDDEEEEEDGEIINEQAQNINKNNEEKEEVKDKRKEKNTVFGKGHNQQKIMTTKQLRRRRYALRASKICQIEMKEEMEEFQVRKQRRVEKRVNQEEKEKKQQQSRYSQFESACKRTDLRNSELIDSSLLSLVQSPLQVKSSSFILSPKLVHFIQNTNQI